jgi:N-acetylglucosaminyl-diphospho-decaprenol L-rhamnosyltransferase
VTKAVSRQFVLDVVVVNYNGGWYLRKCIQSLFAAERPNFSWGKVVVVDNASTDDSIHTVPDSDLPVKVVRNAANRGFAAANNQGARLGNADLILFLNPDARVAPGTLARSVAFMADPHNAQVGICGGQMLAEDGTPRASCSRFPTLMMLIAKMTGFAHLFPDRVPTQRIRPDEMRESGIVDQVIGAFFMVRRDVFEALGGFDERFFLYMEEVDFAYRARHAGYLSYFLANVPVYHEQGASSSQIGGLRLFYMLRSQTEFARKHWTRWQARVLALLIVLAEVPVRAVLAGVRGGRRELDDVRTAGVLYVRYLVGRARGMSVR